jgi:hypothetical protein
MHVHPIMLLNFVVVTAQAWDHKGSWHKLKLQVASMITSLVSFC